MIAVLEFIGRDANHFLGSLVFVFALGYVIENVITAVRKRP